jgi:hypothetical protein
VLPQVSLRWQWTDYPNWQGTSRSLWAWKLKVRIGNILSRMIGRETFLVFIDRNCDQDSCFIFRMFRVQISSWESYFVIMMASFRYSQFLIYNHPVIR